MLRSPLAPIRRLAALAVLAGATFALDVPAVAAETLLYMRIDGVKGENPPKQPLGADAFKIMNFEISVEKTEAPDAAGGPAPERFGDVSFALAVSGPAVALWQLAAQGDAQQRASLVAVDAATGEASYRVDLEQVVVRSLGIQTLGIRDAAVGALGYQRARIRYGEGDDAATASWDRARNAPWK